MKPPCIRGLSCFRKGCPQRPWNGEDGCPAWIEVDMRSKDGQVVEKIRECVDLYLPRLIFSTNCLLEGNQQAVESFRNGMVFKDEHGAVSPKPNPAEVLLLRVFEKIQENMAQKKISGQMKGVIEE